MCARAPAPLRSNWRATVFRSSKKRSAANCSRFSWRNGLKTSSANRKSWIYFGAGLYGAEAASRGYFGKPAREMSLAECATLAGLIKSPNRLSPWTDRATSREARDYALDRMREIGFINREQCTNSRGQEIVVGSRQNAQGQTYAVDYIRQQVIAAVGWDRAINEGYRIHTTI